MDGGHDADAVAAAVARRSTRKEVLEREHSHVAHCSACHGALTNARRGRSVANLTVIGALVLAGLVARLRGAMCLLAAAALATEKACASIERRLADGKYPPPRNA